MQARDEILRFISRETLRAWQVYLAGNSGSFLTRHSQVYRLYCEAA